MNILVLCHKPPYPPVDGGTIASLQIITDLQCAGHQVVVLAMSTPKHPGETDNIPNDLKKKIDFIYIDIDTTVHVQGILQNWFFSKLPYTAERFISKKYSSALMDVLTQFDFDLVQLEGLYLTPYIPLIKKEYKLPIALRSHNIENEIWQRILKSKLNIAKRFYLKNLSKRMKNFEVAAINQYDFLVPISQKDLRWFEDNGNKKPSKVIPAAISDNKLPAIKPPVHAPDAFYLGALDWKPNQEGLKWFIKKCWPQLQKSHPQIMFHIAGRGAPASLVKQLSKDRNIVYHGRVADASEYMLAHNIMVVPLFSGSGMRIKIIEAMAHGRAVVTTSIGTEGVESHHGENILIADNPSGFIACVDQLLNNPDYLNKLGLQAQQLIRDKYTSSVIGKNISDFYCHHLSC